MATKNNKKKEIPETATFCETDKCKLLNLKYKDLVKLIEPEVKWFVLHSLAGDERFYNKCPRMIRVKSIDAHSRDEIEWKTNAKEGPDWDNDPFISYMEVYGTVEYWEKKINQPDLNFVAIISNVNGSDEVCACDYHVLISEFCPNYSPLEFNIFDEEEKD